jgi:hypothetical protein
MRAFGNGLHRGLVAGALLAVVLATSAAQAQATSDDAWRFNITPYVWVPTLNTTIANNDVPIEVEANAGTSDFLNNLKLPILVCGEVQKGRFGLLYDFQYLKFADSGNVGSTGADLDTGFTFADSTLGLEYQVIAEPEKLSLDLFGGARAIYAKADIHIGATGSTPSVGGDQDRVWIDPIVGLKANWRFAEHWFLGGYADVGGFGVSSDLTYQLMGFVGYSFNDHFALVGGYRYFFDDYSHGNFELNAKVYGPVVGLSFTF